MDYRAYAEVGLTGALVVLATYVVGRLHRPLMRSVGFRGYDGKTQPASLSHVCLEAAIVTLWALAARTAVTWALRYALGRPPSPQAAAVGFFLATPAMTSVLPEFRAALAGLAGA